MGKIGGREVNLPDENGRYDALGHSVCLKIIPECQDPNGPHESYARGEVVNLLLCERGWCEDAHEPVPVTRHEVGLLIEELKKLHAEMA